jgi:hypothetical protein
VNQKGAKIAIRLGATTLARAEGNSNWEAKAERMPGACHCAGEYTMRLELSVPFLDSLNGKRKSVTRELV